MGSPPGQGYVWGAAGGADAAPEFILTKGHLLSLEMHRQGAKG